MLRIFYLVKIGLVSIFSFLVVSDAETEEINNYYPLKVGNRWEYETKYSEDSSIPKKYIIVVKSSDRKWDADVFVVKQGEKKNDSYNWQNAQWFSVNENGDVLWYAMVNQEELILVEWDPPFLLLPLDLSVGLKWYHVFETYKDTHPGKTFFGITKFIVESMNEKITVPAGEFDNCIKIKCEYYNPDSTLTGILYKWHAYGVGKIKSVNIKQEKVTSCEELISYNFN